MSLEDTNRRLAEYAAASTTNQGLTVDLLSDLTRLVENLNDRVTQLESRVSDVPVVED